MIVVKLDHPRVKRFVAHQLCERSLEPLLAELGSDLPLTLSRELAGQLESRLSQGLRPGQQLELSLVRVGVAVRPGAGVDVLG